MYRRNKGGGKEGRKEYKWGVHVLFNFFLLSLLFFRAIFLCLISLATFLHERFVGDMVSKRGLWYRSCLQE